MNDKYQTVSVRLSWGEYKALQAQAQAEYTSQCQACCAGC